MAAEQADREDGQSLLKRLRNSIEFAQAAQFLLFFRSAFGFDDDFCTMELEDLLIYEPDSLTGKTTKFYQRILKLLPSSRIPAGTSWLRSAAREYQKRSINIPFDDGEPPAFSRLSLEQRIQMLNDLCRFHLTNADAFLQLLHGRDLGRKEGREGWELVCITLEDWEGFIANGLSSKPADRKLRSSLEILLPKLVPALEKVSAYRRKKPTIPAEYLPRKRSARLQQKQIESALKKQPLLTLPTELTRGQRMELRRQRIEKEKETGIAESPREHYPAASPIKLILRKSQDGAYDSELFIGGKKTDAKDCRQPRQDGAAVEGSFEDLGKKNDSVSAKDCKPLKHDEAIAEKASESLERKSDGFSAATKDYRHPRQDEAVAEKPFEDSEKKSDRLAAILLAQLADRKIE